MVQKRLISTVALILTTVVVLSTSTILANKKDIKRQEIALSFVSDLAELYRTEGVNFENYVMTDSAKESLKTYLDNLKDLDNLYVVIPELDIEEDVVAPPDIEDIIEEEIIEEEPLVDQDNPYLYQEAGETRIKVNDLEIENSEYALVEVYGGSLKIYLSEIPETYSMKKSNPRYVYRELETVKSKEEKNTVIVKLKSVLDSHIFRVKVEFKGTTISDFKAN